MSEERLTTWRPFVERMREKGWDDRRISERLASFGLSNVEVASLVGGEDASPPRVPPSAPTPPADDEPPSARASLSSGCAIAGFVLMAGAVSLVALGCGIAWAALLFIVLNFPVLIYCFAHGEKSRLLTAAAGWGAALTVAGGVIGLSLVSGSTEAVLGLVPILFGTIGWLVGVHLGVLISVLAARKSRGGRHHRGRVAPSWPSTVPSSTAGSPELGAATPPSSPRPTPASEPPSVAGPVSEKRLATGLKYVARAREHGKADPVIVEALRHAGWDQVELAALSQALEEPLGKGTQVVREEPLIGKARVDGSGWSGAKIRRLLGALIPLTFAGYNVAACLFYALIHRPMPVWGGDDGIMVGIPGVGLPADTVEPGSGMWWIIFLMYSVTFSWIAIVIARRMRARSAEESEGRPADAREIETPSRPPASPPPTPVGTRPGAVKRIALIDPSMTRNVRVALIVGAALLLFILISLLLSGATGEAAAEAWGSVIYCLLVAVVTPLALWLGFRHAASTEIVLGSDDLRLERGGKPMWRVPWSEVTGWWAELGGTANLKSIAIRCRDGNCRRIGMSWLGLPASQYGALFREIEQYSGMSEVPPAQVERDITRLSTGVLIAITVIVVIATIAVLMQKP